ncbi:hypothetical protein BLNAU_17828 [Blattamonas nauphoetae]|uniref:Sister chromatid cohesion C-terminal domain-containing protein n=1 Tax=Blattamonas nauphoetae TaxID=2049346 RepID=A0ABQ9X674_9EUKA|nr:hypothetical protein BLNAU_17828 [Blattamonas nauphoetae]
MYPVARHSLIDAAMHPQSKSRHSRGKKAVWASDLEDFAETAFCLMEFLSFESVSVDLIGIDTIDNIYQFFRFLFTDVFLPLLSPSKKKMWEDTIKHEIEESNKLAIPEDRQDVSSLTFPIPTQNQLAIVATSVSISLRMFSKMVSVRYIRELDAVKMVGWLMPLFQINLDIVNDLIETSIRILTFIFGAFPGLRSGMMDDIYEILTSHQAPYKIAPKEDTEFDNRDVQQDTTSSLTSSIPHHINLFLCIVQCSHGRDSADGEDGLMGETNKAKSDSTIATTRFMKRCSLEDMLKALSNLFRDWLSSMDGVSLPTASVTPQQNDDIANNPQLQGKVTKQSQKTSQPTSTQLTKALCASLSSLVSHLLPLLTDPEWPGATAVIFVLAQILTRSLNQHHHSAQNVSQCVIMRRTHTISILGEILGHLTSLTSVPKSCQPRLFDNVQQKETERLEKEETLLNQIIEHSHSMKSCPVDFSTFSHLPPPNPESKPQIPHAQPICANCCQPINIPSQRIPMQMLSPLTPSPTSRILNCSICQSPLHRVCSQHSRFGTPAVWTGEAVNRIGPLQKEESDEVVCLGCVLVSSQNHPLYGRGPLVDVPGQKEAKKPKKKGGKKQKATAETHDTETATINQDHPQPLQSLGPLQPRKPHLSETVIVSLILSLLSRLSSQVEDHSLLHSHKITSKQQVSSYRQKLSQPLSTLIPSIRRTLPYATGFSSNHAAHILSLLSRQFNAVAFSIGWWKETAKSMKCSVYLIRSLDALLDLFHSLNDTGQSQLIEGHSTFEQGSDDQMDDAFLKHVLQRDDTALLIHPPFLSPLLNTLSLIQPSLITQVLSDENDDNDTMAIKQEALPPPEGEEAFSFVKNAPDKDSISQLNGDQNSVIPFPASFGLTQIKPYLLAILEHSFSFSLLASLTQIIFTHLVEAAKDDQVGVRTQALVQLSALLTSPTSDIITAHSKDTLSLVSIIQQSISDTSSKVREAAVSVAGQVIGKRDNSTLDQNQLWCLHILIDRTNDSSLAVRKKALQLLFFFILRSSQTFPDQINEQQVPIIKVLKAILLRTDDGDFGIRDDSAWELGELWFRGFHRNRPPDNQVTTAVPSPAEAVSPLSARVDLLILSVRSVKDSSLQREDWFISLFDRIIKMGFASQDVSTNDGNVGVLDAIASELVRKLPNSTVPEQGNTPTKDSQDNDGATVVHSHSTLDILRTIGILCQHDATVFVPHASFLFTYIHIPDSSHGSVSPTQDPSTFVLKEILNILKLILNKTRNGLDTTSEDVALNVSPDDLEVAENCLCKLLVTLKWNVLLEPTVETLSILISKHTHNSSILFNLLIRHLRFLQLSQNLRDATFKETVDQDARNFELCYTLKPSASSTTTNQGKNLQHYQLIINPTSQKHSVLHQMFSFDSFPFPFIQNTRIPHSTTLATLVRSILIISYLFKHFDFSTIPLKDMLDSVNLGGSASPHVDKTSSLAALMELTPTNITFRVFKMVVYFSTFRNEYIAARAIEATGNILSANRWLLLYPFVRKEWNEEVPLRNEYIKQMRVKTHPKTEEEVSVTWLQQMSLWLNGLPGRPVSVAIKAAQMRALLTIFQSERARLLKSTRLHIMQKDVQFRGLGNTNQKVKRAEPSFSPRRNVVKPRSVKKPKLAMDSSDNSSQSSGESSSPATPAPVKTRPTQQQTPPARTGSLSAHLMQTFLKPITNGAIDFQSEELRRTSVEVIGVGLKDGIIHPSTIIPSLVCVLLDPVQRNADLAFSHLQTSILARSGGKPKKTSNKAVNIAEDALLAMGFTQKPKKGSLSGWISVSAIAEGIVDSFRFLQQISIYQARRSASSPRFPPGPNISSLSFPLISQLYALLISATDVHSGIALISDIGGWIWRDYEAIKDTVSHSDAVFHFQRGVFLCSVMAGLPISSQEELVTELQVLNGMIMKMMPDLDNTAASQNADPKPSEDLSTEHGMLVDDEIEQDQPPEIGVTKKTQRKSSPPMIHVSLCQLCLFRAVLLFRSSLRTYYGIKLDDEVDVHLDVSEIGTQKKVAVKRDKFGQSMEVSLPVSIQTTTELQRKGGDEKGGMTIDRLIVIVDELQELVDEEESGMGGAAILVKQIEDALGQKKTKTPRKKAAKPKQASKKRKKERDDWSEENSDSEFFERKSLPVRSTRNKRTSGKEAYPLMLSSDDSDDS